MFIRYWIGIFFEITDCYMESATFFTDSYALLCREIHAYLQSFMKKSKKKVLTKKAPFRDWRNLVAELVLGARLMILNQFIEWECERDALVTSII